MCHMRRRIHVSYEEEDACEYLSLPVSATVHVVVPTVHKCVCTVAHER
jgi:hypothetical protein